MTRLLSFLILIVTFAVAVTAQQAAKAIPAPSDVAKPPADATTTASGLATKVLQPGTGESRPSATDLVTVHYSGWTTDGKMFDSSLTTGSPITFPLNRVIKGWTEGVQLMAIGEKRRLWIPEALAYAGTPKRPAGMLVFDVELLGIPSLPPPDVGAPPPDAKRTASGLAYKSQKPGTGSQRPEKTSQVTVHYTGWTTDGKMFDSSTLQGKPVTFGLDQVIEGWTEGVQLMAVGETMRFWIPERLAYKGERPPRGMLVFDVELVAIK